MTTVQVASSATLSVVLVPRKAVAHREVAVQEEALREVVPQEALRRESLAVVAVAPAVMMTTITTHRATVAEAVGDNFFHKTDKTFKTIVVETSNGSQPLAVATPD